MATRLAGSRRAVVLIISRRAAHTQARQSRPKQAPPPPAPPARQPSPSNQPSRTSNTPPVPSVSFLPGPSNIPNAPLAIPSQPDPAHLRAADSLFLYKNRGIQAEFLYSVPRFLELPRNTLVPEVCLLGRSNVGKSTVINALAGISASRAGSINAHLAKKGRTDGGVSGLAVTSSRAGCTQTLNAYGFGPPPTLQLPGCEKLQSFGSVDADDDVEHQLSRAKPVGGRSRNEVREDAKERARHRETHRHSLYVMDFPGYGHNSRDEWGAEILKYISKRTALRGAVLLIDATAGFKDADRVTLALLRDANIRTAVVLTKGNRAALAFDPARHGAADLHNDSAVAKRCAEVWEELARAEHARPQTAWSEGSGWMRDIFLTAAGADKASAPGFGMSGLRLAICRLGGLIRHDDAAAAKPVPNLSAKSPSSSKIVSFDDIMWAPSTLPASGQTPPPPEPPAAAHEDAFEAAFAAVSAPSNARAGKRRPPPRSSGPDPFAWGDDRRPEPSSRLGTRPKQPYRSRGGGSSASQAREPARRHGASSSSQSSSARSSSQRPSQSRGAGSSRARASSSPYAQTQRRSSSPSF